MGISETSVLGVVIENYWTRVVVGVDVVVVYFAGKD